MEERINSAILSKALNNKKCREVVCSNYIDENTTISNFIIKWWNLERINQKYIKKSRNFDENSYSKKMIKKEEVIFARKSALFQPLRFYIQEQIWIKTTLFEEDLTSLANDVDTNFFKETLFWEKSNIPFPLEPLTFKKNNMYRVDVNKKLLQSNELRQIVIDYYIENYWVLCNQIITDYHLKFLVYKYKDHTLTNFESSYTRAKIKRQEIFFIKKVFQFTIWLNRMERFRALRRSLLIDFLIEKDSAAIKRNQSFLEELVKDVIKQYENNELDNLYYIHLS